jgi:apolipoprotein D and lipocalin family protein
MQARKLIHTIGALFAACALCACVSKPEQITPVEHFDASRYLGKWYEIARLDHSFERGMNNVTAEYSLRPDGGIAVLNRGYKVDTGWKEALGKAYFVERPDIGYLKVSFFGPFYGAYIVFDLDAEQYRSSMVSGPDKSYLWLLSRTPTMDEATKKRLVAKAQALGFDTSKLIYVAHETPPQTMRKE